MAGSGSPIDRPGGQSVRLKGLWGQKSFFDPPPDFPDIQEMVLT